MLIAEAERLEDQKSKDHRNELGGSSLPVLDLSSLDVFADNTAVITVGGSQRNLGVVMSVNSAATRMFGYSRLQFERLSVFRLLPPPIAELHEASLRQCTF